MTMSIITDFIDLFIHLDEHLVQLLNDYGLWIYPILFLIIFCETGLVFTPFLPGDSLLFAVGALAAAGSLNIFLLFALFASAAILGDTVNYWVGKYFGHEIIEKRRWIKEEYLQKTRKFFEKYGGKTIVIARFIPFVRTFAPFLAGTGSMHYPRFLIFNIVGGLAWVTLFLFVGFFFGNLPFVERNFGFVIIGIIIVSFIPVIFEWIKSRRQTLQK